MLSHWRSMESVPYTGAEVLLYYNGRAILAFWSDGHAANDERPVHQEGWYTGISETGNHGLQRIPWTPQYWAPKPWFFELQPNQPILVEATVERITGNTVLIRCIDDSGGIYAANVPLSACRAREDAVAYSPPVPATSTVAREPRRRRVLINPLVQTLDDAENTRDPYWRD